MKRGWTGVGAAATLFALGTGACSEGAGERDGAGEAPATQVVPEVSHVQFTASDGVTVWADVHRGGGARPLILLFHQGGGDARGEYGFLVPELVARGYDVMTTDLRRGGDLFGSENRTVAGLGDAEYTYCDAAPDVAAALDHALTLPGVVGRPILWGSSYSAALVIRLAAERPEDVEAVLAFSPATGEPMDGCAPEEALAALTSPALALRPDREAAIPAIAEQLRVLEEGGVETYVASGGVHGSSMLNPARVDDVSGTWAVVDAFLRRVGPPR